jgi:predicted porin
LKKLPLLISAAIPLLVATSTFAQSSVTLYGVLDANLNRQKGGTTTRTGLDGGSWNGNRWGLRGTEDLGGGLKANFVLESGFSIDTGNSGQGGRLFGRNAYVGLSGGFGTVRLGRQWAPIAGLTDEFGTKDNDLLVVASTIGAANFRNDNAATYITPNLGGFTAEAQYSTRRDGSESAAERNFLKTYGLNAQYKGGPVHVGVGYMEIADVNSATPGNQKNKGLIAYGAYDFGVGRLKAVYNRDDRLLAKNPTTYGLSWTMPFGSLNVGLGYGLVKDSKGSSGAVSDDASVITAQAVYQLSKRTSLYSIATSVSNKDGANLGFNSPSLGKNSNYLAVGVRHFF